VSVTNIFYILC